MHISTLRRLKREREQKEIKRKEPVPELHFQIRDDGSTLLFKQQIICPENITTTLPQLSALSGLQCINVSSCHFLNDGLSFFLSNICTPLHELSKLRIYSSKLRPEDATLIANAICNVPQDDDEEEDDEIVVVENINNPNNNHNINNNSNSSLKQLVELDLFDNCIGNDGLISISKALSKNTTLTILKVAQNSIDDMGMTYLANTLEKYQSCCLAQLDISGNGVTDQGAFIIAEVIANPIKALRLIDISNNRCTLEGTQKVYSATLQLTQDPESSFEISSDTFI